MKSLERRLERLEARVMTREDYIAFAVSQGCDEAFARAALADAEAWCRAHPNPSEADFEQHMQDVADKIGCSVQRVKKTSEQLAQHLKAYKRARGGRHAQW